MTEAVVWHNADQTILHLQYPDRWHWEDLQAILRRGQTLLDAIDHTAVAILDLRGVQTMPAQAFQHGKLALQYYHHPRLHSELVLLAADKFVRMITQAFERLYGERHGFSYCYATTLDEAIAAADQLLTTLRHAEPSPPAN